MSKRVCLDCPAIIDRSSRDGRCDACRRERDRARGSRQERGYDADHQAKRKHWEPLVATGNVKCWRCGEYIPAGPFDLGHDDLDRSKHRGPEHVACNRATAGR